LLLLRGPATAGEGRDAGHRAAGMRLGRGQGVQGASLPAFSPASPPRRRVSQTQTQQRACRPHNNAVCAAQQVMSKFSMQSGGADKKEPSEKKSKKEKAKHKKERKRKHSSKRKDSDSDSGSDSSECATRPPPRHPRQPSLCKRVEIGLLRHVLRGCQRATPCIRCEPPARQARAPS